MADAHAHGGVGRLGEALDARRADSRRRMLLALAINAVLLGATFVGALLTGSLALLADAGHLLSDVGAIGLGLVAGGLASLPGGPRPTFGYQRTEVIAAPANGIALVVIAVLVAVAAVDALGSLGVIVSGGVILATGWEPIDPIAGLAIAGLILASSARLIGEPFDVL